MKLKQTSTRTMPCAFSALAILICLCSLSSAEVLSRQTSISKHKQQLAEINSQLTRLANYNPRSGVGVGGFRSKREKRADHLQWVEIDLGQTYKIDEVILVPEIRRSTNTTLLTDGFPEAFRILAGTAADQKGKVIASYTSDDNILPRIAPLVIACDDIEASWIRLEATTLSPRAWDGGYALHLFEMLVFSGHENVALHQPVKASSQNVQASDKYKPALLVDGFLPYVMDTAKGERSPAFVATSSPDQPGYLSIDLGKAQTLDQVHLHAVDLSDAIPQKRFNNFGMPRHMIVEGANAEDFNDAITLTEFKVASVFEAGPILMKRFPAFSCRYVRLRVLEPNIELSPEAGAPAYSNIGFAEIELFSNGINVAKAKQANGNYGFSTFNRSYASLTDGRNFYGDILPIRQWLNELALRHKLERQRPQLSLRLNELYEEQKSQLNRLIAVAVILAAAMIVTLLVTRMTRMRQLAKIRLRLAADLHDELGANLHTIGLLSDLAVESREDDEAFADIQRRIRSEADRSGAEVRGCMDLLALRNYYENLEADMQRAARRIMAKLDHELIIEGEPYLKKLKPRVRVDLFLFYKECLVNISRHASATAFSSHLSADKAGVRLIIRDNGIGIDEQQDGMTPKSLERRAGLLRAKVRIDHPAEGGTVVTLTIPAKRLGIFKSIYL
jgi:signal transduction histidine kinase